MKRIKNFLYTMVLASILIGCLSGCIRNSNEIDEVYSDPTMPLVKLPTEFTAHRQNANHTDKSKDYVDILDVEGPGCVRSFWLLRIEGRSIEIIVDGADEPQVNMPLESFMGSLLDFGHYTINSTPIVALPNELNKKDGGTGIPGYTCYFPIPFQESCRIRVYYNNTEGGLGAMVNWHKYNKDETITPYRFYAHRNIEKPAQSRGGMFKMLEAEGNGFVAGIFLGVKQLAHDDYMYHTGGMHWLIDGETNPVVMRGQNMEDDYGFTWGFHPICTPWFGCPYQSQTDRLDQEAVAYRFFGPDPIPFKSSIHLNKGSRPDDTEAVVYYYLKAGSSAPEVTSPKEWQVVGTFECINEDEFNRLDHPELVDEVWADDFTINGEKFTVHNMKPERTWINLNRKYITPAWTPFALTEVSVYARASIDSDKDKKADFKLSFDDWITVWLNGNKIGTFKHEEGFETESIPVNLKKGKNNIVLKYANFNKLPNNRQWVFNLVVQ